MKKIFTLIAAAACAASVNAQVHILDINKIYEDAKSKVITTASLVSSSSTTKYQFKETVTQDIFTVKATSGRAWQIDTLATVQDYGDYKATAKFIASGGSNNTGGRQLFVTVPEPGELSFGGFGTDGKYIAVIKAENTEDYVNTDNYQTTSVFYHNFSDGGGENIANNKVFTTKIKEAGIYCLVHLGSVNITYVKFVDEKTATGINNAAASAARQDSKVYNLAGQEVADSFKGIVVKNGRKMVRK